MPWRARHPIGPGDWVLARERIPVTVTDHLLGAGIQPGTRGVVTSRTASLLEVDFATGYGTTTVTTRASTCTLARRGGGQQSSHSRTRVITTIRLALAAFLLWPLVQFVLSYLWHERTLNGIEAALAVAAVDSLLAWVGAMLAEPGRALAYLGFLAVISKIAFR